MAKMYLRNDLHLAHAGQQARKGTGAGAAAREPGCLGKRASNATDAAGLERRRN